MHSWKNIPVNPSKSMALSALSLKPVFFTSSKIRIAHKAAFSSSETYSEMWHNKEKLVTSPSYWKCLCKCSTSSFTMASSSSKQSPCEFRILLTLPFCLLLLTRLWNNLVFLSLLTNKSYPAFCCQKRSSNADIYYIQLLLFAWQLYFH